MTDQIDELSNNTLQSVAKKRVEQSKEAGGVGINNPTRAKAMTLLRKSDNAKYRHTEHPDKVTPKVARPEPTDADKAAHAKAQKAKIDSQNNRHYGEGRYMGDSVEQIGVEDQINENDPLRRSLTGDKPSNKELIAFHKAKLAELGPNAYKSHREYHEKFIRKLMKEEVESIDELSMDTVKSYKAKVAINPAPSKTTPNLLHKAIRRFAGKERAEDRIHSDEMKKMRERLGLKNEEVLEEDAAQKNMSNAMDNIDPSKRDAARKQYEDAREKGLTHASSLSLMYQRFGKANEEVDQVDEGKAENIAKLRKDYSDAKGWVDMSKSDHERRGHEATAQKIKNHARSQYKIDLDRKDGKLDEAFEKPKSAKTKEIEKSDNAAHARQNPPMEIQKPKIVEHIVKVGSKFRLVSKAAGKNLGTFDTKAEAEKREGQVEYFKHADEGVVDSIKKGIKYVKRGFQGWPDNGTLRQFKHEPNGPKAIVDRNKSYTDDEVKAVHKSFSVDKQAPKPGTPAALQKRVLDREMKKRGLTTEEVKTEKPAHKVGDTVWATSPTNKALTMTGKVTKIGQTLTTVKHKDGSEAHYPHKLVNNDYEVLHPNPYKKMQREHLEQTGELLSLDEVKYIIENQDGGAGAIAAHSGVDNHAPAGTGKVKKMMGNKTDAVAIAKLIANGVQSKEQKESE